MKMKINNSTNLKKFISPIFIFVITFILYAIILQPWFYYLSYFFALIPSIFFGWLFYKQNMDRFSFIIFTTTTYFLSFFLITWVAFPHITNFIPNTFFMYDVYKILRISAFIISIIPAWLFYKYGKSR